MIAIISLVASLIGKHVIKLSAFARFRLLMGYHVFYCIYCTIDLIACLYRLLFILCGCLSFAYSFLRLFDVMKIWTLTCETWYHALVRNEPLPDNLCFPPSTLGGYLTSLYPRESKPTKNEEHLMGGNYLVSYINIWPLCCTPEINLIGCQLELKSVFKF